LPRGPINVNDVGKHRLLQIPDPGERWHSRPQQHGRSVAGRRQRDRDHSEKSRSAVVVISTVFFALTVVSTLAIGVFCRKRNTVFVLQKCEQRDYAAAGADDDDDDDEEELSTDCESTTLPTVVTHVEDVTRRTTAQRRRRRRNLNRATAPPTTPDLSLFCIFSQTGKTNETGSGSTRRDGAPRRAASEERRSWVELGLSAAAAARSTTAVPVECTDYDTDDDDNNAKYCVARGDDTSVSWLLRCDVTGTSGPCDSGNDSGRFQRSTSLNADVCRFALTRAAVSSQPLMTRQHSPNASSARQLDDSQMTSTCSVPSPNRQLANDGAELETTAFPSSIYDDIDHHANEAKIEPIT